MNNFKEKYGPWALIIGASQGLGAGFAENCAKRGLNVAICARTLSKLDKVAENLRSKYSVETRTFTVDITDPECAAVIEKNVEDLDIGFCIFNAATEAGGPFVRMKLEDHEKNITGNCLTSTRVAYYICRRLAKRKKGAFYLVASIAGQGGIGNWVSYGASKGYELLLGEGLWYEMKSCGVDAGTYVVGSTETPEFKASQDKHQTGLSSESKGGMKGLKKVIRPKSPDAVAAALFGQIGKGPRLYSASGDRNVSKLMQIMSRKQSVNLISSTTEKYFHGGRNDLLEE